MTPKEHLIARLIALCKTTDGGPDAVALKIGMSSENLRQIIAGYKLPSGEPRGVGTRLQRQLDKFYPGWSGLGRVTPVRGAVGLEEAVQCIGQSLADVPIRTRRVALSMMQSLIDAPQDAAEIGEELRALLAAAKRSAA